MEELPEKLTVILRKGEDNWYVVTCPELRGVATQGRTIRSACKNAGDAIELYLDVVGKHQQR